MAAQRAKALSLRPRRRLWTLRPPPAGDKVEALGLENFFIITDKLDSIRIGAILNRPAAEWL